MTSDPGNSRRFIRRHRVSAVACGLSLLASTAAWAVEDGASAAVKQRYEAERAACMSDRSMQERGACLREAAAARDAARRGELGAGGDAERTDYAKNALRRCQGLPGADRDACIARIQGKGSSSGSAQGGGVYRELVEREAGSPPAGSPPAASPAPTPTP